MTDPRKSTQHTADQAPRPDTDTPGQPAQPPAPDLTNNQTQDPMPIPPAAQRALAEAEERRQKAKEMEMPPELGGRDGPEPVRYGDWEKKGIAVDF